MDVKARNFATEPFQVQRLCANADMDVDSRFGVFWLTRIVAQYRQTSPVHSAFSSHSKRFGKIERKTTYFQVTRGATAFVKHESV
jgi:hypothetical protein